MREELLRHDRADRVAAEIVRAGAAAAVAVEAGQRIGAARLEVAAEDVALTHAVSIPAQAAAATSRTVR